MKYIEIRGIFEKFIDYSQSIRRLINNPDKSRQRLRYAMLIKVSLRYKLTSCDVKQKQDVNKPVTMTKPKGIISISVNIL